MKNCPVCNTPLMMSVATAGTIVKCTKCGAALRDDSESAEQSPPPLSKTQPARVSAPARMPPPPSRKPLAKPRRPSRQIAKRKTSNVFLLTAFCAIAGFCFLLLVINHLNDRSRLPRNERQVTSRKTRSRDGRTSPATLAPVSPTPNFNHSKSTPASTSNSSTPASTPGNTNPSVPAESTGGRVFEKTLKSAVFVLNKQNVGVYTGSGFVIDQSQRLVVTAYHVVKNQREVWVSFPAYTRNNKLIRDKSYYSSAAARLVRGKVVVQLKDKDLALLQLDTIPSGFSAIKLATNQVQTFETVYTVGNPGASAVMWAGSTGEVRGFRDQYSFQLKSGQNVVADVIETQNPTNPGDSGGPVVNNRSELVGVTCGGAPNADLLSLCIDASEVRRLLARFRP